MTRRSRMPDLSSRTGRLATVAAAFVTLALAAILWPDAPVSAQTAAAGVDPASIEFYTSSVQPILKTNCYSCHGGINHRGGLKLDTKAGMLKGGKEGVVLTPGHPEDSLLIKLIRHEGPANDPMPMPLKGKLSDADIATITAWVKAGAIMPNDAP